MLLALALAEIVCVVVVLWQCGVSVHNVPCVHPKRPRVHVEYVPVCTFETSPCMPAYTRTCVSTCARGAGTHEDVLNIHTS